MTKSEKFIDKLEHYQEDRFVTIMATDLLDIIRDACEKTCDSTKEEACYLFDSRIAELTDWIEHEWVYLSQEDSICSTNEFLSKTISRFLTLDSNEIAV